MFRDLKEYQNLQKLYEEKVSKVENINEENVRGANMKGSVNVGNMFKKIGDALKPKPIVRPQGSTSVRQSSVNTNKNVKIDRSRNIPVMDGPVNNPEYGKNMSRSKEDLNPPKVDTSKGPEVIEPENQSREFGPGGQPSASEQIKRARLAGKTGREKAQELAKMRIGSGTAKNPDTTIAQVKKKNQDAMERRAAERFADFKAKREAKRLERMKKEEYTPYDIVLEYLLSSEQATTIEEANYVMMQLDEENIQEIVRTIMKTPLVKLVPAAAATIATTKFVASKMGQKSGENEIQQSTTPVPVPDKNKKKNKGEDLLKQGIEVIKKAKENPGTGLNPNTREALKIMNNNGY